jgi:alpha-glucosidase
VVDVDGRDPERAPIPWRPPSVAGPGAGFTTGEPWLPLVADAERLCVERQAADPSSTLSLVRRLAALRAGSPALQTGRQRMVDVGPGVLAWLREEDDDRLLAAVDFAAEPRVLPVGAPATVLVSTDPDRPQVPAPVRGLELRPDEAVLLRFVGG